MSRGGAPRQPLPRVVKQLGTVSFFNDLASEMVYPLLPALITTRLGGTAVTLGALDGISEAVAAVVKAGSGWLSDRPRLRRPLVICGYVVATVTRPAMGFASAAWQVIGLRATDRVGKGVRNPPRDTIIAEASPVGLQGRAFGFHRAMTTRGSVTGPLVAWALLTGAALTPSQVIQWSVIPGVVAVLVVSWALRKLPSTPSEPRTVSPAAGVLQSDSAPCCSASLSPLLSHDSPKCCCCSGCMISVWRWRPFRSCGRRFTWSARSPAILAVG